MCPRGRPGGQRRRRGFNLCRQDFFGLKIDKTSGLIQALYVFCAFSWFSVVTVKTYQQNNFVTLNEDFV